MARAPIYAEIKRSLMEEIDRGDLSEGTRLAPEVELAQRFSVSRPTVRQAILELVREGVLARRRGHGTFVLRKRIEYPTGRLTSFTEEFGRKGSRVDARIIEKSIDPASRELAVKLGIPIGSPIFRLERVRLVNGEPVAWSRSSIAYWKVPAIEAHDFRTASLYRTLQFRYGITVATADETIQAAVADATVAGLLEIEPGSPVFEIERRAFTESGDLVEIANSVYRPEHYEVRLLLRR